MCLGESIICHKEGKCRISIRHKGPYIIFLSDINIQDTFTSVSLALNRIRQSSLVDWVCVNNAVCKVDHFQANILNNLTLKKIRGYCNSFIQNSLTT